MKLEKILVPIEIHGSAKAMLPAVEEIARTGVDDITLLYVMNIRDTGGDPSLLEHDKEVMNTWKGRLFACGTQDIKTDVRSGIPGIEIIEAAEDENPSLIVMGSHGRSLIPRILLGSQTDYVLSQATHPLLILRLSILKEGDPNTCTLSTKTVFQKILFLTDFSEDAEKCIPFIEWMSAANPESLIIMHVQDTRRLWSATKEEIIAFNEKDAVRLAGLKEHFRNLAIPQIVTEMVTGNAIDEILSVAETFRPTVIVMGATGRTGTRRTTLGGVAEAVSHRAGCHTLIVR
ncbi:universal stress protein UspA [Methanocalculus chunghsingensis]|uniref:Universal stress protein UspA n=1 Tax=Methanocalculus chunghsingensis TaxID=156457 RepID=A0A8J8B5V6_9EURY|nr:universal stress protein [Methanocalculus chunghsingensis]MBR1369444.1 universal stress protein UspA [Methanocalculus chunghsingensis]